MVGDYIIKDITAKNGHLYPIHDDIMGAECFIADLEKGYRSFLRCKPNGDDKYHRIHTSAVIDVKANDDESDVIIETLNTVYHLVRNNFDNTTFNGIVSYTYEVAKATVLDYFSEKDEEFFKKHNTTKDAVLGSDNVISYCATAYHNIIKDFGVDYAWASYLACSQGLPKALASANK